MKKAEVILIGVVSGVAVWAITRALEQYETKTEPQELHSRITATIKNKMQFHRANEIKAGRL